MTRTVSPIDGGVGKAMPVRLLVVAPDVSVVTTSIERLTRAFHHVGMEVVTEHPEGSPQEVLAHGKDTLALLLADGGSGAASWSRAVGLDDWPVHDGYHVESRPPPSNGGRPSVVVAAGDPRGLLYGCQALADETIRQRGFPVELHLRDEPRFPIRGWESQMDVTWCGWMSGSPDTDWFRDQHYLQYLRDALSRAPEYRVNTLMLMGPNDHGELHTYVDYRGWDELCEHRQDTASERQEQVEVLEQLAGEAHRFGVRLLVWDHELQVAPGIEQLYPEVRGQEHPVCPSSPLVWRLLADKYEEFFARLPSVDGIVLTFGETQIGLVGGSPCRCDQCRGQTGTDFLSRIIASASDACQRHGRQLIVRTDSGGAEGIAAAALAVQPQASQPTLMAKMTPNVDFCSLEMHPNAVVGQYSRTGLSTILEDVVGEYRAKTHIVCLPAEYYARHLRHGDAAGGDGAVIRLDHSSFPRSVFETPNEFNVWLTSQLTWQPQHPVDELWRDWTSRRYGDEAAPLVRDALKHTADVWEHSTNSFGFYCTSAHG